MSTPAPASADGGWGRSVRLAVAVALGCVAACTGESPAGRAPSSSGSAPAAASADTASARVEAILVAEHRRVAGDVAAADQQSRAVTVRRAAARALSRIGGEATRAGLLRALSDEDREVVAWGAYGLGYWCKGHERENVSALVARALSLPEAPAPATEGGEAPPALLASPSGAIARAIGRCAADESEPTLVAWLAGPRELAVEAAFALGELASSRHKLREETLVALMNTAAGSAAAPPVPEALFPVGRLENVPPTVEDRVREVATARLATPGDARIFAVRALGRAGRDAAAELSRVLGSADAFTPAERAEAARALKRLDKAGIRPLADGLASLAPSSDPIALTGLVGDSTGVLLTTIDALAAPGPAEKTLQKLAALPLSPAAPPAIARRIAWIRCGASKVLAGANFREPLLGSCDVTAAGGDAGAATPSSASIGARAMVEVIGRGELTGARLTAWRALATGSELRAREAAIELLGDHDEVAGAADVLASALGAKERGLVATAAEVIAKHPERAVDDAPAAKRGKRRRRRGKDKDAKDMVEAASGAPSPQISAALLAALALPGLEEDPEVVGHVVDAVGALALKEATPRLEAICRSPYPTNREHAEKALGLVGVKTLCAPVAGEPPPELFHRAAVATTLTFQTDAGAVAMTLDPSAAPAAVTRAIELARAGYYSGKIVHRVIPGFVAQLGAPEGDGFGGPGGMQPLRCETSPIPFAPLTVGVALSGRDTGSSQLFVLHSRYPHLDGGYAWIGTASGPWATLVDGDVILSVSVSP